MLSPHHIERLRFSEYRACRKIKNKRVRRLEMRRLEEARFD